ncbi:putative strictosidine synthase [Helianthus anomalus]
MLTVVAEARVQHASLKTDFAPLLKTTRLSPRVQQPKQFVLPEKATRPSGLSGGGGPAVSSDGTFVLVPELGGSRISKYWLVGPKANTVELLLNNVGSPNKIKRAERFGEFWVALSVGFRPPTPLTTPQGVRFNSNGVVLQTVSFVTQFFNKSISIVQEQNGNLYVGSHTYQS